MRFKWTSDLVMVVYGATGDRQFADTHADTAFPPVDVVVAGGHAHIYADLPGVDSDDVFIYIQYDHLVIEGVKRAKCPPSANRRFLRVERLYKPFKRTIQLHAPVNPDSIRSELTDGVLHITWKKD